MSNFPIQIDNDFTLPPVNNNITEVGSEAINSLREAVIAIEEEIGASTTPTLGSKGSCSSLAERLNVSLNPDGTIKASILLLSNVFPIYDDNIAEDAAIKESKIDLFCDTETLYNNYLSVSSIAESSSNWIYSIGNRLQNHIFQTNSESGEYNHFLSQIHVSDGQIYPVNEYFVNRFTNINPIDPASNGGPGRDNSDLHNLLKDINSDYLIHQKSDGYKLNASVYSVRTLSGESYPSNFAHTASGLYLNSSNYTVFPNTIDNLQDFADYIDQNNDLLAGKRAYDLFSSGISRTSRSSALSLDGYGSPVVPVTQAITFLLQGSSSVPQDNPINGDDIIQLVPPTSSSDLKTFNNNFSLVKVGDVIRVNYGLVPSVGVIESEFLVKEIKYLPSVGGGQPSYSVRIDGKNLLATANAYVRIDRALFNVNKGGVLAVSAAQCLDDDNVNSITNVPPSLIVSHPRGAVAIGTGFDPSQINETNYLLYLTLYPNGDINNPLEMVGVDITGNKGATPGKYSLEKIVNATNNSFRKKGFNYRFSAFSYNGNFGIMLADSYNNASFSIVAGELRSGKYTIDYGFNNQNFSHPRNIIQYDSDGLVTSDPLGFGRGKANVASPFYYQATFTEEDAFNYPKKILSPLRRNNYYIDGAGIESDKVSRDIDQSIATYGDGYWQAELVSYDSTTGVFRYKINKDLSSSGLSKGKTLVVQSLGYGSSINFGRFIITNVEFNICSTNDSEDQTFITVFNGMHTTGVNNSAPSVLPTSSLQPGDLCAIYFNYDSVGFNLEHSSDNNSYTSFKRHFEVYLDKQGKTFSLERARMNISSSQITIDSSVKLNADATLSKFDIVRVSPKLRGFTYNLSNLLYLVVSDYNEYGEFTAHLRSYYSPSPGSAPQQYNGKPVSAKKGEVFRLYDQTNIDYIDFIINDGEEVDPFSSEKRIAIQLFPTLTLDQEVMLLASVQLNGVTNTVSNILDLREFGNISEKDISTSLINYLNVPEKLIHSNGVIRGFDIDNVTTETGTFSISGGVILVDGKFAQLNNRTLKVPAIQELYNGISYPITLCLCINAQSEYDFVSILDYDSELGTVNNSRDFKAYSYLQSQGTGNPYSIKSYYFKDLIKSHNNLTPVYLIKLKITGSTPVYDFSIEDVRKFINNEPLNNTFTWSDQSSTTASYFKSFNAVKNWINLYGSESNVIKIKGNIRLDDVNSSYNFSQFNNPVIFEGDGVSAGFDIWNSQFNIGSNIVFRNLNINFIHNGNFSLSQDLLSENCAFEKVNFTQGPNYIFGGWQLLVDIYNSNKFKDCQFTTSMQSMSLYNYNSFEDCVFDTIYSPSTSSSNMISIGNNNKFINCQFNKLKSDAENLILSNQSYDSGNNNIIDNCSFASDSSAGNFNSGLLLNNDNIIKNCKFTTNFSFNQSFIRLNYGNTLENILIGTDHSNRSTWKTITSGSVGDWDAIYVTNNNILDNIKCLSIRVLSDDAAAINFNGKNNTLSNSTFDNIFSIKNALKISNGNTLLNNKFNSLQSKSGIFLTSNNNYLDETIIDRCFINYIYASTASDQIAEGDYVRSNLGGAIYFDGTKRNEVSTISKLENVSITNCKFYNKTSLGAYGTLSIYNTGDAVNQTNSYIPPYINFYNVSENKTNFSNIKIEGCFFNKFEDNSDSDPSIGNVYHAAISLIVDILDSPFNFYPVNIDNLFIKNNILNGTNGILIAGINGESSFTARNVHISNNNARYISAYASPPISDGCIFIEENTCTAILTLSNLGSKITSTLKDTENLIISNNKVQCIDIYSNETSTTINGF